MFRRVSPEKARSLQSSASEFSQSNNTDSAETETNGTSEPHVASETNGASTSNAASNSVKTTTRTEFEAVFPSIVQDLIQHCKRYNSPENAVNWFKTVRKCWLLASRYR